MHSRSLVRSASAPAILVHPAAAEQAVDHASLQQLARERLLHEIAVWRASEGFGPGDDKLLCALLLHAEYGEGALDLREHRSALRRAPDGVMQALVADAHSRKAPVVRLVLPGSMRRLPAWLNHFVHLKSLVLPGCRADRIDLSALAALEHLVVSDVRWPDQKLVLPHAAVVIELDTPERFICSTESLLSGAAVVQMCWRRYNHATQIAQTDVEIECRHIALKSLEIWAGLDWEHVPIDAMDPGSFTWIKNESQLSASVSLKIHTACRALAFRPARSHVVALACWQGFAMEMRERLLAKGKPCAFAMLNTVTHAMPVVFALNASQELIILTLDPNFTDQPVLCRPQDGIEALFVRWRECHGLYFARSGDVSEATLFVTINLVDDPRHPMRSTSSKHGEVSLTFAGLPATWHAELVRQLMSTGSAQGLDDLAAFIAQGGLPGHDVIKALWDGRDRGYGVPWAFGPASAGHAHVMSAWGQCLLTAFEKGLISAQQICNALSIGHHWETLLSRAMASNHRRFLFCFADVVQRLFAAKALKAHDVYQIFSLLGDADRHFSKVIHSAKVARALKTIWRSLREQGALSDAGYKNLRLFLKSVDRRQRMF